MGFEDKMRADIVQQQAAGIRACKGDVIGSPPRDLGILVEEARQRGNPSTLAAAAIGRVESRLKQIAELEETINVVFNDRVDLLLIADLACPEAEPVEV